MKNITIKNSVVVGSVEWLKDELNNMEFKFGNRDGIPSVDFGKRKENGKVETWFTAVVLESPDDHYMEECCKNEGGVWVTYASGQKLNEYEWSMFPYLTDAAERYAEGLITKLAIELKKKVANDKGDLNIKVTVE